MLGVIQAIAAKNGDVILAHCDERDVLQFFSVQENKKSKKYTVIYEEAWMSGSHGQVVTKMKRITVLPEEALNDVLTREKVIDIMVFLLEGWPSHIDADGSPMSQDENGNTIG